MRLASHAGAGLRSMASHGGGGGWPGGTGGLPPGPLGGAQSIFGDGTYTGNIIQGGSVLQPVAGVLTITAAATVAPDADTGASVLMCDTLVLDGAGASLAPSTNSKGLIVYAKTAIQLLNGARLHIDKLGKAGNFGNLTAYSLTPASLRRRLKKDALEFYVVLGEGAPMGPSQYTGSGGTGSTGYAASTMQTGGGGNGAAQTVGCYNGRGGKGGPCCGGAGGGGMHSGVGGLSGSSGGDYGGPGGYGQNSSYDPDYTYGGGGAGDPVGTGVNYGQGAGGGLLVLLSPIVSISSGCVISADGAKGGNGGYSGGGSAGGGCIVITTDAGGYTNFGTVRASGGSATTGSWAYGGAGGAGSVNIFTVA